MQLDLEVLVVSQKIITTLWVMGSIPIHSNVIVQLVRTIDNFAGSNPAPFFDSVRQMVSQAQTENLYFREHHS
ncbi:hypothetical protein MW871_10870 [Flavobacterium sp. I-SCBP12n]|uniref:Uncharacterized protein n=2 Tax=Flavobacterium TaxID=237 RepID=A0A9X1XVF5_9FLAO|nr:MULTISPECIES: hypothetical protein [Flavobacterium]MBP4142220.1 hypothetical protein [Flavobacterium flabelliforme]MCK8142393.1 hypothetical protein [Flavobacterium pygoscelis]